MILKHESQRCIQNTVEHLRWSYLRKIVDSFLRLSIFAESSILAVRLGSEYASKLQRIACNRTHTPPHKPKTLLTLIVHYINIFYRTSRFKKCSNLDITKKKKTFFNFLVYFINWKHLVFSLKHTRTSEKQMVENSIIIQYLSFFSDIIFKLFP